ncbi:hypothetical protein [Catellatospora sp. NPDC049609]|uniref:hypothetical protein n=1 Tax=Catellatospora sp. NPDC049609 TaxID=3155505 RepID=UPI003413013D
MNRRAARVRPWLVLSLVAGLAAACSPGDPAPAGSAAPPPAAAYSPAPGRATVTERAVRLDVPAGYQAFVEFADARHGYAMFNDCGTNGSCQGGLLFASADGGATWQPRQVPGKADHNVQLYVVGPEQIMLWSETAGGYHLSRDGGRTYTFAAEVPHDYQAATGIRYGVAYGAQEAVLTDWQTGRPVPLPDGYQGGGATVTRDGVIWLTRFDKIKETARSADGGRTWQRLAVPEQPGRPLFAMFVRLSPGGDAWLIGEQDPMSTGGGTSLLRGSVLKGTGLPLVWQLAGGAWTPRPIEGVREKPNFPYSVAPAGDGLLAIAGPDGTGYLADRYVEVPGTPRLDWVTVLPDGTLFARQNAEGRVYLGTGHGSAREWLDLTVR